MRADPLSQTCDSWQKLGPTTNDRQSGALMRPGTTSGRRLTWNSAMIPHLDGTEVNLYSVLNVPKTATSAEIRRAYRRVAIKVHPDKNAHLDDEGNDFQLLKHAQAVLLDPKERKKYDTRNEWISSHASRVVDHRQGAEATRPPTADNPNSSLFTDPFTMWPEMEEKRSASKPQTPSALSPVRRGTTPHRSTPLRKVSTPHRKIPPRSPGSVPPRSPSAWAWGFGQEPLDDLATTCDSWSSRFASTGDSWPNFGTSEQWSPKLAQTCDAWPSAKLAPSCDVWPPKAQTSESWKLGDSPRKDRQARTLDTLRSHCRGAGFRLAAGAKERPAKRPGLVSISGSPVGRRR